MNTKEIYFAAGCFWGAQKYFILIRGVLDTEVGFANGTIPSPTYEQVYTDTTGYAETVKVVYDTDVLGLEPLIRLFIKAIDPFSVNQQGNDVGTRYRTGIYYTDQAEKPVIQEVMSNIESELGQKTAIEILPLKNYYPAEEYHQDYLDKNPNGYCHITPNLFKFAKTANREFTPDRITELKPNEVFVFGSNLEGMHGGGAAYIAMEKFGAIWGQGVGMQGQCYAIPTMQGGVDTIKPYVDEFITFAKAHPELKFYVTRIGCGIAGFTDEEIAPLFKDALNVDNIVLPKSFVKIID